MTDVTKRELEVLLTLQDQMTRELRRVTGEAEKFESKTRRVGRRVRDTFGSIRDMVGKVRGAIRGLINPLTIIGGAVGVGAVTALGRELSAAAANAEELQSKFEAIAGDRAGNLQQWIDELSVSVRRGRLEIKQMVSDTTPFLERITGSAEAAEASSKALTQLAIDVGSFYNVADDEVLQRFRSALVGSGEALDIFGARIAAAGLEEEAFTRGITEQERELTENEKVLTRMAILFERFPAAMGDASRTADSFTNRMKELRGIAADVRAEFGERLNRAILEGMDDAGGVERVRELIESFYGSVAELSRLGIGVAARMAEATSDLVDDLGGSEAVLKRMELFVDDFLLAIDEFALRASRVIESLGALVPDFVADIPGMFDGGLGEAFDRSAAENRRILDELRAEGRALLETSREVSKSGSSTRDALVAQDRIDAIRREGQQLREVLAIQERRLELEQRLAALGVESESASRGILPGRFRGGIDSVPTGPSQLETTQGSADSALASIVGPGGQASAAGSGSGPFAFIADSAEKAKARVAELVETSRQAAQAFSNRQVANLADTFLSIANGARSASDAVKGFFQQFLADLLRLQTISAFQTLFGGTFQGLFGAVNPVVASGFANGGVVGGSLSESIPVKGYASGGPIVNSPHLALIGEGRYNEAVVPLPDGRSIPVMMQGAGGRGPGGGTSVNVQFAVNAVDARSVTNLLAEDGKELARVIGYAFARDRNLRAIVRGQA